MSGRNTRIISAIWPALRVEFGQLLAEQRQQQAHVKGQRAARDEPGQRLGAVVTHLVGRALAAERVALGLVHDDLQSEHRDIIPHLRLQLEQVPPGALVSVAVHDALHQLGDGQRQVRLIHGNS